MPALPRRRQPVLIAAKCLACAVLAWAMPGAAAQPAADAAVPVVEQGGSQYVNHGLVASGSLPATTLDFLGDTLGSFSSLAVARGSWRRVDGGYEGTLWTLPDRGRNDPDAGVFFDYPARLQRMQLRIADGQVRLSPQGGIELRDFEGRPFTGADPGSGTRVQHGHVLPSPAGGVGAGKISLDAEALAFTADGHFYIGDEYAANVYYFDAQGRLQGVIAPPAAIVPQRDGAAAFGSLKAPRQGRRNNQGVEGMALSPDGRRLFVALQSALVQDTAAGDASGRINTRVLVYDIAHDPLPEVPIAHYVVQLPAFRHDGGSGPADRTAAQSELRALDDHRLLLLARDSNGLGADDDDRPVFKQVLLVDTHGATNLAGGQYEQTAASVLASAESTSLRDGIEPATVMPLIDMLVPSQLARFGLGLQRDDPGLALLSEKWESMDLVPALDLDHPRDWLLLVGNDNDFIARHCLMRGQRCDSRFDNDNRLLVYRLNLPAH